MEGRLRKQAGAESLMSNSHGTLSMIVEDGFLQGRRGKWHDCIKCDAFHLEQISLPL